MWVQVYVCVCIILSVGRGEEGKVKQLRAIENVYSVSANQHKMKQWPRNIILIRVLGSFQIEAEHFREYRFPF